MQFLVAFIRRSPAVIAILALAVGFVLGLLYGWVLNPPEFVNATPGSLRADLQEDYLRMAIDSYLVNQSQDLAVQRWQNLGPAAVAAFTNIQKDPRGANPQIITAFGKLIQAVLGSSSGTPAEAVSGSGRSSIIRLAVTIGGILAMMVILVAGVVFGRRLLTKRTSAEPTPVMQATEINRQTEKTNFETLGLAPPITQTMTTYMLGDDLYDESFSIDTAGGEFLGEYGVGVSEAIGVGEPKKVTALEIWLFDKNDINTATKVLMSGHAFNDPGIRGRLERKGDLILLERQQQVLLETKTLQLLATVVDLEYGGGAMPQNSYFERVTLELAVWPK